MFIKGGFIFGVYLANATIKIRIAIIWYYLLVRQDQFVFYVVLATINFFRCINSWRRRSYLIAISTLCRIYFFCKIMFIKWFIYCGVIGFGNESRSCSRMTFFRFIDFPNSTSYRVKIEYFCRSIITIYYGKWFSIM